MRRIFHWVKNMGKKEVFSQGIRNGQECLLYKLLVFGGKDIVMGDLL